MKAIVPKIEIISNPGAIFASEIKSEKVSLVNHQVVSFVIASAIGAEAVKTTVSVIGANENAYLGKHAEYRAGSNHQHRRKEKGKVLCRNRNSRYAHRNEVQLRCA